MKPDAPAEYRGLWKPIKTKVPGFDVTELYPEAGEDHRQVLDRPLAAPQHRRPLRRRAPDADDQGHGRQRGEQRRRSSPASARSSTASSARAKPGLPGYVAIPYGMSIGIRPGYFGGHFLGAQHNPFETVNDAGSPELQGARTSDLTRGLTIDKLDDRRSLSKHFDTMRKHLDEPARHEGDGPVLARRRTSSSPARRPGGRSTSRKEDPRLRDQYGRHPLGPEHAAGPAAGRGRLHVRRPSTSAAGTTTGT